MKISCLQTHIINWTGFAMRLLHVYFGCLGIAVCHNQANHGQEAIGGKKHLLQRAGR